jgi:hypothetical protein
MRPLHPVLLIAATLATATSCRRDGSAAPAGQIVIEDVGFRTPESVLHDPIGDHYLVSNINGGPADADDNGFISKVATDGSIIALKWIDGESDSLTLHAPKGMAVVDLFLYVADLNVIRRYDRSTGAPRGEIEVPGATFLNDVVANDSGDVYFTDSGLRSGANGLEPSGTDAVYVLRADGRLETLATGPELGRPNGIALAGDSVWVVGFGSGELYRVKDGARTDVVKLAAGGLDGLVAAFGELFISSWEGETIYRGRPGGPFSPLLQGVKVPADIGHDLWRNRIMVPLFDDNLVRIISLIP